MTPTQKKFCKWVLTYIEERVVVDDYNFWYSVADSSGSGRWGWSFPYVKLLITDQLSDTMKLDNKEFHSRFLNYILTERKVWLMHSLSGRTFTYDIPHPFKIKK